MNVALVRRSPQRCSSPHGVLLFSLFPSGASATPYSISTTSLGSLFIGMTFPALSLIVIQMSYLGWHLYHDR